MQRLAVQVARELLAIDADVVALEEVEDCPTLALLLDALAEEGDRSYRAYLVPGKDTHMRMNVALLTRVDPVAALYRTEARAAYPVADSSCGLHGRAPQTSGLSRHAVAMLAPEGFPPMALLLLHLKAVSSKRAHRLRRAREIPTARVHTSLAVCRRRSSQKRRRAAPSGRPRAPWRRVC